MPFLEINLPRIEQVIKERLVHKFTDAFCDATSFPGETFGILFKEYEYGDAANGGDICIEDDGRPYIRFMLHSPRLNRKVKQKLAVALSEAFVKAMDSYDWEPAIYFCEHPYDDIVVEGELLSDKYQELADKEFYYELPDD